MARRNAERTIFSGFDRPESNFFRMPNSWTDITAEIDSIAELKVVEYILRHTWGFQEYEIKKHITIDEFTNGRRRQDGSRIDRGTGLSERAVYDGLRKAVENGLIEEEIDDTDRGRVKKYYSLRMRETMTTEEPPQTLQPGVQSLQGGVQSPRGRGANFAPRTEKETRERNYDHSNFERNTDNFRETGQAPRPRSRPTGHHTEPAFDPDLPTRDGRELSETPRGASLRRTIRSSQNSENRDHIAAFLTDFAMELGDESPLSSTITRALGIFETVGMPPEQWGDVLYQARSRTQEHTAQIRKSAGEGATGMRRKNKMPYFLATLEQLVGLRPNRVKNLSLGEHNP